MAKRQHEVQAASSGNQRMMRQTTTIEDSLLPSSDEIAKLKVHDPNILEWLKERTAKEQDFRHSFYQKQVDNNDNADKRHHNTSRLGIITFAGLMVFCMGCCAYLLYKDHTVSGSMFGGVGMTLAIGQAIGNVRFGKKASEPEKPKQ